jgi:DNA mismatch repair protein MutS
MVEMTETANILNNATPRSLIILDEIGRGTSTYDGLAIAWSVVEYLYNCAAVKAKTLFATHYHELLQLEAQLPGIVNCNVAVREHRDTVVFLHEIVRGGSDRSYGIHVAQLAGLPDAVIRRAHTILDHLEATHQEKAIATTVAAPPRPAARPAPAPDAAPRPQSPESVLSDDQLQLSLFS